MKLAVLTDIHANLPALRAALAAIRREGVDGIVHTGDAIAIGPHPAECLDLLLSTPGVRFVRGNHDAWFADGLPQPQPAWMSDGEVRHQIWTHALLNETHLRAVRAWPYRISEEIEGVRASFVHYALAASGEDFEDLVRVPSAPSFDVAFASERAEVVFFGHDHRAADVAGQARYFSPGSLGCHDRPHARYCIATFARGACAIDARSAEYDDAELIAAFEQRAVPERAFIARAFFGARFVTSASPAGRAG